MRIDLASVTPRPQRLKSVPAQMLLEDYVKRAARYAPVQRITYESEAAFLQELDREARRTRGIFILLDSRGQGLTSETIAERLRFYRDGGVQQIVSAIGPGDGWSSAAWNRADLRMSFGAITLPHELALVVLAEQVYRALTIIAGHPYHGGHS